MSSIRRILSSRANGARSIGPVTAEGKRRSAQNATSHGLLAHQIVMQDESPEGFEAVMNNHLDRLETFGRFILHNDLVGEEAMAGGILSRTPLALGGDRTDGASAISAGR